MGSSTDVHCFACGYDQQLLIGGGFRGQASWWPVSCPHCAAITTANARQAPQVCSACKSPDVLELTDPRVSGQQIENAAFDAEDSGLPSGRCRCPKCGEWELRFGTNVGKHFPIMWD
jgi:hypothetical protein